MPRMQTGWGEGWEKRLEVKLPGGVKAMGI